MMTEDDLDALFAAARTTPARPPEGLVARVLADAAATSAAAAQPRPAAPHPARGPGLWAAVSGLFGGTGALAGMVSATVAGFWLGFVQPMDGAILSGMLGADTAEIEMMPGLDALLDEAP